MLQTKSHSFENCLICVEIKNDKNAETVASWKFGKLLFWSDWSTATCIAFFYNKYNN